MSDAPSRTVRVRPSEVGFDTAEGRRQHDEDRLPPTVWLVGAGPGDPDLLTLRAARTLAAADVVLCDDLVDRRVLALVREGARVLHVGKRGGRTSTDQGFIHRVMIREACRGQRVVRLKGGDPFVFGRGGEERDALRAAGIAVEVVPGLTAGIAAPAAVGISVTDRRHAAGVAFVTGHARDGGSGPDWDALARSGLTLVIYMGIARCTAIADALIAGGLSPRTPAAAIGSAHTPRQRHLASSLGRLAADVEQARIESPAILVVGEVARGSGALASPCGHAAASVDAAPSSANTRATDDHAVAA
jgi:uroporphyrin-III C-methyltransferase